SCGDGAGTYLGAGSAKRVVEETDGVRSHADALTGHRDAPSVETNARIPANEAESVSTRQMNEKTRNSPGTREIATPERTYRWRKVSADGIDVYVPLNAPIAVPRRRIVFGQVESGDERIAQSVEGETAGGGDGDQDGGDSDVDGTTSSGDADSERVEVALLAV